MGPYTRLLLSVKKERSNALLYDGTTDYNKSCKKKIFNMFFSVVAVTLSPENGQITGFPIEEPLLIVAAQLSFPYYGRCL